MGSIFKADFVTAFLANPYFCLKPGKHDVTLTSFRAGVSELRSFSFVSLRQIDGLEVLKFDNDLFVTSGNIVEK